MDRRRIPARPGRHRQCDDASAKARAYPRDARRYRMRLILWPLTFDDLVVGWLTGPSVRESADSAAGSDRAGPSGATATPDGPA